MLLSCATGSHEDYSVVLTPEIVNRLSSRRVELAYLSPLDVRDYIRDLFREYRRAECKVDGFFPLTEEACFSLGRALNKVTDGQVTPRRLNEALDRLLEDVARGAIEGPVEALGVQSWVDGPGSAALSRLREGG